MTGQAVREDTDYMINYFIHIYLIKIIVTENGSKSIVFNFS
jgi:hypothetical protein